MARGAMLSLCVALLTATSAMAQSQTVRPAFGPFHPPMTIEAAMAAAPEFDWQIEHSRRSGALTEASSSGLEFAGGVWTVKVATDIDTAPYGNVFSFDLRRVIDVRNARGCRDALSEIVAALEPMYGAFGQHPSFAGRGPLYGAPWGRFNIVDAGASSKMRAYHGDVGVQEFTTFNEVDEAGGRAVMAGATYYDEMRQCELRIHDFQDNYRPERAAQARARN